MLAIDIVRVARLPPTCRCARWPDAITADSLRKAISTTHQALRRDFGLAQPRIAVLGLNPHAGEDGHLGREELDLIIPAAAAAQRGHEPDRPRRGHCPAGETGRFRRRRHVPRPGPPALKYSGFGAGHQYHPGVCPTRAWWWTMAPP